MHQPQDDIAQEFFRIGREIRDQFLQYSPVPGLSPGQFQMLCAIYHRKHGFCPCGAETEQSDASGVQIGELAQRMRCAVPTVSQRADELEALGYLERRRSPQDRRAVYLVFTPKARVLMDRVMQLYDGFGRQLAQRLGEEQLLAFLQTLNDLKTAIAAQQAEITAALAAQDTEKEH